MKCRLSTRILSAFLAFVMFVSQLPLNAIAEELQGESAQTQTETITPQVQTTPTEPEEEDPAGSIVDNVPVGDKQYLDNGLVLQVNADGKSWTVVDFIAPAAVEITIPDSYLEMPITRIADLAFKGKEKLTTVTLSDNIQYIGDDVFSGCTSLKFNVHDNVNYLGTDSNDYFYLVSVNADQNTYDIRGETKIVASYAFHNCKSLTEIVIPESVIQVGFRSLRGCDNLKSVTLPFAGEVEQGDTNNHVGFAFGARTYGGNISFIPETLTSLVIKRGTLQKNALYGLDTVEHLGLPSMQQPLAYYYGGETYNDNINYIPVALKSVEIASGKIPAYAFCECIAVENVTLGNGVTSIGDHAFAECSKLTSVGCGENSQLTNIGSYAFHYCSSLTSIEIPDSVTDIESYAFYWCNGLISVTFGENSQLTSIGSYAFDNCSSLTSIEIPDSVTSIGDYAFMYCRSLTSVTFGENSQLTIIGDDAFYDCDSLTSIAIPDSVMSIGDDAFYGCSRLTSIGIPSSVTSIGDDAFYRTGYYNEETNWENQVLYIGHHLIEAKTSIGGMYTIKEGTLTIANYAFYNCISLTSIGIPSSMTSIGNYAFRDCTSLTSVTFGESSQLTSIGDNAFRSCSSLTSVTFGENSQLSSIGSSAFWGCSSLTSIEIPSGVTSIGNYAFYKCSSLTSIEIPSGVTNISDHAFNSCSSLTSVTFGENSLLTGIGKYAFSGCYGLMSIEIPDSVTSIGDYAFDGCGGLTSVAFGKNSQLTNLGECAFCECSSLMSIEVPIGVTSIYSNAFRDCTGLIRVVFDENSQLTSIGDAAFDGCSSLTSIEIPSGVTSIGNYAFAGCSKLTSIAIPSGVTSIGYRAFYGCSSLTSINIPSGVTDVGDYAFYDCSSLTSVNIPSGVISIGNYAFFGCSKLTSINIPSGVTDVGDCAFYNCSSLTSITFGENSQLTSIGKYAFYGCSSLESIYYGGIYAQWNAVPKGSYWNYNTNAYIIYCYDATVNRYGTVTYIGQNTQAAAQAAGSTAAESYRISVTSKMGIRYSVVLPHIRLQNEAMFQAASATEHCSVGLVYTSNGDGTCYVSDIGTCTDTDIVIPAMSPDGDKVTSIGNYAFDGCSSLTSIEIPDSVTSIGNYAFDGCSSLTSVTIGENSQLTSIGDDAFYNCDSLTSIVIPSSVTSIGNHAFFWCRSLTSIEIPDSVTSIGRSAFNNCSSLTSVTIGENSQLTSIGDAAFYYCNSLTSITIPFVGATKDGTSYTHFGYIFGASSYSGNSENVPSSLKTVVITGGTSIGERAFYNCSSLTSIEIPDSVTSIGNYAFYNCDSLTSIVIPSSVTSIGSYAFYNCDSLTSIEIPDSVTSIGSYAFYNCDSLTSIEIPDSVTSIGSSAFNNCSSLTSVTFGENSQLTSIGSSAFSDCDNLTSIEIPDGVISIGSSAFDGCSSLTSITFGENSQLSSIGSFAFDDCSSLTNIEIPSSVTSIGYRAFYGCHSLMAVHITDIVAWCGISFADQTANPLWLYDGGNLYLNNVLVTELQIPAAVTSIGSYAFYNCSNLKTVIFAEGSKVQSIGTQAFAGTAIGGTGSIVYPNGRLSWRYIQKATDWDSGLTTWADSFDFGEDSGVLYEMADDRREFYVGEYNGVDANVILPELFVGRPVTKIYEKAFYNAETVQTVIVPDTICDISRYTFYNCPNLTSIEIQGTEATIERAMIYGCNALTTLTVPFLGSNLKDTENAYIGYFFGAANAQANEEYVPMSLKTVILTDVTAIGNYAFEDCKYLQLVVLPDAVESIGEYAFANCEGLSGAWQLPTSLKMIGKQAFASCNGITSFVLPEGLESIGNSAFAHCISLLEFVIPNSVTSIGTMILDSCNNIKTIKIGSDLTAIPDVDAGNPLFGINKALSSLTTYVVDEDNIRFKTDERGVLYELHETLGVEVAVLDAPAKANLKDYVLPDHIVYIAPYAFAYNTTLRWIQLDRVRRIDKCAFMEASSLVAAVFGSEKGMDEEAEEIANLYNAYVADKQRDGEVYSQVIGEKAFFGCDMLQYVNLWTDFVAAIGMQAFYGCEKLTDVRLSASVKDIGHEAFGGTNLERIIVHEDNMRYRSNDYVLYEQLEDGTYKLLLYPSCKITEDGLNYLVENGKKYQTVFDLPTDMHISAVESYAFQNAKYLQIVNLDPVYDMLVGDYAFDGSKIWAINIGEKVTSLGLIRGEGEYTVFSNCKALTSIEVDAENSYYSSENGVLLDKSKTKLIKYPEQKAGSEYVLPDTVSVIASMAFKGNTNLLGVVIPSYIYTVGLESFYGCENLASIYFDHVYAPISVMENAFTTSTQEGSIQALLCYSASYFENGNQGELGWQTYRGIYPLYETNVVPSYDTEREGEQYYAVVVVDSAGKPINDITVSLTDPNGEINVIKTKDGIAMFYNLYETEGLGFTLDFERSYELVVTDERDVEKTQIRYFTYENAALMLDAEMCISYVTLTMEPSVYGVDCNGVDINTETADINKAEFGTTQVFGDDADGNLIILEEKPETIKITVIGNFDPSWNVDFENCMLYQNGTAISGCVLLQGESAVVAGRATLVYEVPVESLRPEVRIESRFAVLGAGENRKTCTAFLNIDVIDFFVSEDDINLEAPELNMDLSDGGDILMTLLGAKDWNFKIGKNTKISSVADGKTLTVSLNSAFEKHKSNKTGSFTKDYKKGYNDNHGAHNKNTWFFQYEASVKDEDGVSHKYTVNIRFARGTQSENYYYYRLYIYEGDYNNAKVEKYGVVNALNGRKGAQAQSLLIYYEYISAAKEAKDIKKGSVREEPIFSHLFDEGSATTHDFEVTIYGDIKFQYEKGRGLVPVSSLIKGTLEYKFVHQQQMMIWIIPVYLEVSVDINGEIVLEINYDNGRSISIDEFKMTVEAEVSAQVGVGCKVLSVGVSGTIGTVLVVEFLPDPGVESWRVYGDLSGYVTYITIQWKKGFLGIKYPTFGTETKKDTIFAFDDYIIGGPETGTDEAYAVDIGALYLAEAYGAADPSSYQEKASLFVSEGEIYKVGYVNMLGQITSAESDQYDEYNYLKLALFKWNDSESNWGTPVVLDDNGYNDFHYSLQETEKGHTLVFTQQTEKTNAETTEDTYEYVSDLSVKYVCLDDPDAKIAVQEVANDPYFKYLSTAAVVSDVPTVVWAENADNNMFGVSPDNYLDNNGDVHTFETTANSLWMSRMVNGTWTTPECIADGLATVMDISITDDGRILYILDTNCNLADADDRVLYHIVPGQTGSEAFNALQEISILSAQPDGNGFVYYYQSNQEDAAKTSGILYHSFAEGSEPINMPEDYLEGISDYEFVRNAEGKVLAIIYPNTISWKDISGTNRTAQTLFAIFCENGQWGAPIEIVTEDIFPREDVRIASYDAVYKPGTSDTLLLTVEYSNLDGSMAQIVSCNYVMESDLEVVDRHIDYKNQLLSVEFVNRGARAAEVFITIAQEQQISLGTVASGKQVTFTIDLKGHGMTPTVAFYDGNTNSVVHTILDIDLNYSDLRPVAKQLLLGSKNVLLVAVRNDGNYPNSGTLYVELGNHSIDEMKSLNGGIATGLINPGSIAYYEVVLDGQLQVDENTIVTICVDEDAPVEKGSAAENNILYATINSYVRSVAADGSDYELEVENDFARFDPKQPDVVEIVYFGNVNNGLLKVMVDGKELQEGMDYVISAVSEGGSINAAVLQIVYLETLKPGSYQVELAFADGETAVVELQVVQNYQATWMDGDQTLSQSNVAEGVIPNYSDEIVRGEDAQYVYIFAGWDHTGDGIADVITAIDRDVTYTAVWKAIPRTYTVTWTMTTTSGEEMHVEETYCYGDIPNYLGKLFCPEGMQFDAWDKQVEMVTEDTSYTAVYETIKPVLQGIKVTILPNKITYMQGQKLDLTGLVVKKIMSDGTEATIPNSWLDVYADLSQVGTTDVMIAYNGFTATYSIIVEEMDPALAPKITIENVRTVAGRAIRVAVKLENNPGIISLRYQIVYDETVMELINVQDTGLVNGFVEPAPGSSSPYVLRWMDSKATENNNADGTIVILTFGILEDAEDGDYSISIEPIEARNCEGGTETFQGGTATVTVADVLLGDVDGDGEVTDWDVILLNRYLAGWDNIDIDLLAADVDNDGEVTDWDCILLDRYLMGWDVQLG